MELLKLRFYEDCFAGGGTGQGQSARARAARNLEAKAIEILGLEGIDFEDNEQLVRAKESIDKLLDNTKIALADESSAASLIKALYKLYAIHLYDLQSELVELRTLIRDADNALDKLQESCDSLKKNFWEYGKAVQFAGLKEEDMEKAIAKEASVHDRLTLEGLEEEAIQGKDHLESISEGLRNLQTLIDNLAESFDKLRKG